MSTLRFISTPVVFFFFNRYLNNAKLKGYHVGDQIFAILNVQPAGACEHARNQSLIATCELIMCYQSRALWGQFDCASDI